MTAHIVLPCCRVDVGSLAAKFCISSDGRLGVKAFKDPYRDFFFSSNIKDLSYRDLFINSKHSDMPMT